MTNEELKSIKDGDVIDITYLEAPTSIIALCSVDNDVIMCEDILIYSDSGSTVDEPWELTSNIDDYNLNKILFNHKPKTILSIINAQYPEYLI